MSRRERDPRRGQRSYSSSRRRRDEEDDDEEGMNWGSIFLGLVALAVIVACGIGAVALGPRILAALDRALPPATTQQPGGARPTSTPQARQSGDQSGPTAQSDATPAPEGAVPATPEPTASPAPTMIPLPSVEEVNRRRATVYAEVPFKDVVFKLDPEPFKFFWTNLDWFYTAQPVYRANGTVQVGFERNQMVVERDPENPNKVVVKLYGDPEIISVSLFPPQPGDFQVLENGVYSPITDPSVLQGFSEVGAMQELQNQAWVAFVQGTCQSQLVHDTVISEFKADMEQWLGSFGFEKVEFEISSDKISCVDPRTRADR